MANVYQNIINTELSEADLESILNALTTAESLVPSGGTLIDEQRRRFGGMNVDNREFAGDVLREMTINPSAVLPAVLDPAVLNRDLTLHDQLKTILSKLGQMTGKVQDLKRMVDHEAFGLANAAHGFYQVGAKAGLPGCAQSAEKLSQRYTPQGGKRRKEPEI